MTIETLSSAAKTSPQPNSIPASAIGGPKAKGLRQVLRILNLILRPIDYMESSVERYGDLFQIGADTATPLVYVGDPAVVKEIFALDHTEVDLGNWNQVLQPMVGNHSILLLNGSPHQRQRKLLMPPFHGDRLRTYAQLIVDITHQVSADWQPGQTLLARSPMQELTLGIILQAVFGLREGPRLARVQQLMSTLLDTFAYPISASFLFFPSLQKDWGAWSPWGKFLRLREEVRSL
ncbi:MAG: cytochrome P450, partial [Cyanobacteria bacterium J06648_10]